jgi:hypothetical protein
MTPSPFPLLALQSYGVMLKRVRFTPQEDQRVHEASKQAGTPEDTRPRNAPPPEPKTADAKPTLQDYFWPFTVAAPPAPAPPAPVDPPKRSRSLPGVGNGRASATAACRPRQIKTTAVRSSRPAPPEDSTDSDADWDDISTQCAPGLAAAASCPEPLPSREWTREGGSGGTPLGAPVKDEFKADPCGVYRRCGYEFHRWHCNARVVCLLSRRGRGRGSGPVGQEASRICQWGIRIPVDFWGWGRGCGGRHQGRAVWYANETHRSRARHIVTPSHCISFRRASRECHERGRPCVEPH